MQVDNKVKIFSLEENICRGLTLTNAAVRQIRRLIKNDPAMLGLQLSVKKSGCAGFRYVIKKATQTTSSDHMYEYDGARLYVPLKAIPFIEGTELDYVQDGLNYIFKLNNPKAKHTCGCGDSFSL